LNDLHASPGLCILPKRNIHSKTILIKRELVFPPLSFFLRADILNRSYERTKHFLDILVSYAADSRSAGNRRCGQLTTPAERKPGIEEIQLADHGGPGKDQKFDGCLSGEGTA
jgi:hypothetical protein